MDKYKFFPHDIYNIDESDIHIIQEPESVVKEMGIRSFAPKHQVKEGSLLPLHRVYGISVTGIIIARLLIFPQVKFKEHFIKDAPNGSTGTFRVGGWINEDIFNQYLKHVTPFTR